MRKTITVVVLAILIIGAGAFAVRGLWHRTPPPPDVPMPAFDVTDIQNPKPVTITVDMWSNKLEVMHDTHYERDAKTGRIYAARIMCASCLKEIPMCPVKWGEDPRVALAAYVCPLCHQPASFATAPAGGPD